MLKKIIALTVAAAFGTVAFAQVLLPCHSCRTGEAGCRSRKPATPAALVVAPAAEKKADVKSDAAGRHEEGGQESPQGQGREEGRREEGGSCTGCCGAGTRHCGGSPGTGREAG